MALTKKITIADLARKKLAGEKFAMLTCYDASTAAWQQTGGVESILVGDSLGMTVLGEPDTLGVSMDLSLALTAAVRRGAPLAWLVADMPFMSYRNLDAAMVNAGRYLAEARADVVKLEVGRQQVDLVAAMCAAGLPIMPHIGLSPQRVAQLGGYRVQGNSAASAIELIQTAELLEQAGAVALLLEAVPPEPAGLIAERLRIPVIGCGAGPRCDGFVVVVHDMLGLTPGRVPKFVKKYADLGPAQQQAFEAYVADVHGKAYPAPEHDYAMPEDELAKLKQWAKRP